MQSVHSRRTLEESRPLLLEMTHDQRMASLSESAEMAIAAVTPEKSAEWFYHTQAYLPACLEMADILLYVYFSLVSFVTCFPLIYVNDTWYDLSYTCIQGIFIVYRYLYIVYIMLTSMI